MLPWRFATTSSTSASTSTWRRSVRSRAPDGEEEVDEGELLGRRVEELEAAVERLRGEKEAAEAEEVALRAELDAERGAAETAASEAMLMIERLQREKAAALMEARQFRRLAEGRADRDRELQDELASLSALAASYLSLLHAHGIDPDEDEDEDEEHSVEHTEAEPDVESGGGDGSDIDVKGTVVEESASPLTPPDEKEYEYTIDVRCSAATKAVAAAVEERVVGIAGDLYARMEALEADREVMRRQVAALRAERAQVVLAREMARRLCREAVAAERGTVVTAEKPRFSVLAICKWLFSLIFRRKKCSTARFTFGLPTTLLGLLVLLDTFTALHRRQRLPSQQI